jgi:hypothetical protein
MVGSVPNLNETVLHLFDELATFKSPRSQPFARSQSVSTRKAAT